MNSRNYNPIRDSLELASLASSSVPSAAEGSNARSSISRSSRVFDFANEDPLTNSDHEIPTDTLEARDQNSMLASTFDFGTQLFPLSRTSHFDTFADGPLTRLDRSKTLTYFNGLSLIIGLVIGSGIFSSPSQVNAHVGSPGAALIAWTVAGLLAWTGAACFAELGGALPQNGGAQVYLSIIFGEWLGFIFAWAAILMLKPGSAAIIAIIFGEYVVRAFGGPDAAHDNPWLNKAVALAVLVCVTLLNCVSKKASTRSANALMVLKFVALLAVAITGIVVAATGLSYENGTTNSVWKDLNWFEGTSADAAEWAVTLYAGLWAYDGWDNVNYVAGEFINPKRDIPLVIHTSMPIIIFFYILANAAYYLVLPASVIESSNTVAIAFGSAAYGPLGAVLFALAVSGSCFGSLNASTFSSGRLVYAAGKEGYLPEMFSHIGFGTGLSRGSGLYFYSRRSDKWWSRMIYWMADDDGAGFFHTPINALLLNAGLTAIYILIGEFRTLLSFYGVVGYSFLFLVVLGLIVLRVQKPEMPRPYRTWISTPIIFCCVCLFLLSRTAFSEPIKTVAVFGFVAAGGPVYWFRIGKEKRNRRRAMEYARAAIGRDYQNVNSLYSNRNDGGSGVDEAGLGSAQSPMLDKESGGRSWMVWKRWWS